MQNINETWPERERESERVHLHTIIGHGPLPFGTRVKLIKQR